MALYRPLSFEQRQRLIHHWQRRLEDVTERYWADKDWNQFLLSAHLVRERLGELRRGAAGQEVRRVAAVTATAPTKPKIVPVQFGPGQPAQPGCVAEG